MDNNCKTIALIINNSNDLIIKNPGATHGGGAVVAQNLYGTLINEFNCNIDIYTFMNSQELAGLKNTKVIDINELIPDYTCDKLTCYLDNRSYDKIITISPGNIFRNRLIQVHSIGHRLKKEHILIEIIKYVFLCKKIKENEALYNNLTETDNFIAVSYKIKDDYSKNFGIPLSQIKVVYPGCKQVYTKLPEVIQKDCPTFGIVANSAINKGGHLFLAAAGFAKLISRKKFKILIIAPKYKYDILLRTLVFICGFKKDILVLPKQKDMSNFYKNIDYLILPSKNEAFGLVALEAMSYGKPVLVSNTSGCSEIISTMNGFIFERNSFFDLVNKIIKLLNIYYNDFEHYKSLSTNVHSISLKYSWKSFCQQILDKEPLYTDKSIH